MLGSLERYGGSAFYVRARHDRTRRPPVRRPDRLAVDIDRTARSGAGPAGAALAARRRSARRAQCSERRAARLAKRATAGLPRRGIALCPAPDAGLARRPVAPRAPSRTRGLVVGGRWDLVLLSVPDLSLPDLCRRGVLRGRILRALYLVLLRLPA